MNEAILEELAIIKQKIKTLEAREKELKPLVLEQVELFGKNKKHLEKDYANFTRTVVPVWEYSEVVDQKKEELKMIQIDEQENGIAKKKDRVQLAVKLVK